MATFIAYNLMILFNTTRIMPFRHSVFVLCLLAGLSGCATSKEPKNTAPAFNFYTGSYTLNPGQTGNKGQGIVHFRLDTLGGVNAQTVLDASIRNPSFLTLSADGRFLYAVEETGPGTDTTGHLAAYEVGKTGLRLLNRQSTLGFAPCYVTTDRANEWAFIANYSGGIAMFPIEKNGGLLPATDAHYAQVSGLHPRQEASHPHAAVLSPDESFLYVPDLGADRIWIFRVDRAAKKLVPGSPAFYPLTPASGPRHLCFHPTLPAAYVVHELNNTITPLAWDRASGALTLLQAPVSTLPSGFSGTSYCADIHCTPNGRYLYASNRGHDSLAGFAIDPVSGKLTPLGHYPTRGKFPRNFAIAPGGDWVVVANQHTDNLTAFRIAAGGELDFRWELAAPVTVCIQFAREQ